MRGNDPWMCGATLMVLDNGLEQDEVTISAINLSRDTGKDLETTLTASPDEVFVVFSHDLLTDAQYSYILHDHRDGTVYAVQSCDLEFEPL